MSDNEKDRMNNTKLKNALNELNKIMNSEFAVNSWEFGDSKKTQYGLMRKNKNGTMDIVLESGYTKREIYYHIQGYLIFNRMGISTGVTSQPKEKEAKKKSSK